MSVSCVILVSMEGNFWQFLEDDQKPKMVLAYFLIHKSYEDVVTRRNKTFKKYILVVVDIWNPAADRS